MIRIDPSRTGDIRRAYHAEIRRRFNDLALAIRDYIANQDAFNLNQSPAKFDIPLIRNAYEFATTDDKLKAFQVWLKTQITTKVLGSEQPETPWLAKYTESAYKRGITRAWLDTAKDRGADITKPSGFLEGSQAQFVRQTFSHPERTSKIKMAATRDFAELKGITDSMSAKMSTIFADGMANGRGAGPVARELVAQTGMDRKRADRLARTEIIHYHSEGQLDGFEDLGVEEVGIMAEVLTADDEKVCPICSGKTGKSYTIAQARGIIPFHPNCRCCWIPSTSRSRNKGKKPLKGLKTPSGRAKQESAKGKKVMAPAPTLWGLQPTGVMRWMGSQGWSLQEAEKVLTEKGISFSPNTLKTQLRWGKVGHELKPAALTVDQAAELNVIRFGKVIVPPPIKPPVIKPLPPVPVPIAPPVIKPLEPMVEVKLRPEPEKKTEAKDKPPAWITFSGKPDEFTKKVWAELGGDPAGGVEKYRRVGKVIRDEINKDPEVSRLRDVLEFAESSEAEWMKKRLPVQQTMDRITRELMSLKPTDPAKDELRVKLGKAKVERDAIVREHTNAMNTKALAKANHEKEMKATAVKTLKRVRDFGGAPLDTTADSDRRMVNDLQAAAESLPTDWMKAVASKTMSVEHTERGYFNKGVGTFQKPQIALSSDDKWDHNHHSVGMHELTHAVEAFYRSNGFLKLGPMEQSFVQSRIKPGEKLTMIGGQVGEMGYKDEFLSHYIGRDYGDTTSFEVMSMGVEGVLGGRNVVMGDEDLSHFVLGVLAGF